MAWLGSGKIYFLPWKTPGILSLVSGNHALSITGFCLKIKDKYYMIDGHHLKITGRKLVCFITLFAVCVVLVVNSKVYFTDTIAITYTTTTTK